jgi:hypothetical protein
MYLVSIWTKFSIALKTNFGTGYLSHKTYFQPWDIRTQFLVPLISINHLSSSAWLRTQISKEICWSARKCCIWGANSNSSFHRFQSRIQKEILCYWYQSITWACRPDWGPRSRRRSAGQLGSAAYGMGGMGGKLQELFLPFPSWDQQEFLCY